MLGTSLRILYITSCNLHDYIIREIQLLLVFYKGNKALNIKEMQIEIVTIELLQIKKHASVPWWCGRDSGRALGFLMGTETGTPRFLSGILLYR